MNSSPATLNFVNSDFQSAGVFGEAAKDTNPVLGLNSFSKLAASSFARSSMLLAKIISF